MNFYPNQLFHIYNQGNNRQQIFFSDENYIFFLWKMRAYLLPFGELIGYCLMPNHFHWLFYVNSIKINRDLFREKVDATEWERRKLKYGASAIPPDVGTERKVSDKTQITLNEAIGILQKTYTRAINKEKNWTGSLFRKNAKAKDGWIDEFITLKKSNDKLDYRFLSSNDYAYQCFCYIHNNPVKANLVSNYLDWKFSSARDYEGLRNGNLCNLELGRKLLGL